MAGAMTALQCQVANSDWTHVCRLCHSNHVAKTYLNKNTDRSSTYMSQHLSICQTVNFFFQDCHHRYRCTRCPIVSFQGNYSWTAQHDQHIFGKPTLRKPVTLLLFKRYWRPGIAMLLRPVPWWGRRWRHHLKMTGRCRWCWCPAGTSKCKLNGFS